MCVLEGERGEKVRQGEGGGRGGGGVGYVICTGCAGFDGACRGSCETCVCVKEEEGGMPRS